MNRLVIKFLALSAVISVVIGVSLYALTHFSPQPHEIRPKSVEDMASDTKSGTLGNERLAILLGDTKAYVAEHPDKATPAMKSGKELAPVDYLNAKLEERGDKFRVSKVNGLNVEMFSVS